MGHATRREDALTRPQQMLFVTDRDHVLALDRVKVLVLVRVDVGRGIGERGKLLQY